MPNFNAKKKSSGLENTQTRYEREIAIERAEREAEERIRDEARAKALDIVRRLDDDRAQREADAAEQERERRAQERVEKRPERYRKHSETLRGRIFVNNPESGELRLLPPIEAEKLCRAGWVRGGWKPPARQTKEVADTLRGRKRPTKVKAKIADSLTGRRLSDDHRQKLKGRRPKGKKTWMNRRGVNAVVPKEQVKEFEKSGWKRGQARRKENA